MADMSGDAALVKGLASCLVATMDRLRLLCGRCWTEGRFDPHEGSGLDPAVREEAARHFAQLGWTITSKAICPKCKRANSLLTLQSKSAAEVENL